MLFVHEVFGRGPQKVEQIRLCAQRSVHKGSLFVCVYTFSASSVQSCVCVARLQHERLCCLSAASGRGSVSRLVSKHVTTHIPQKFDHTKIKSFNFVFFKCCVLPGCKIV